MDSLIVCFLKKWSTSGPRSAPTGCLCRREISSCMSLVYSRCHSLPTFLLFSPSCLINISKCSELPSSDAVRARTSAELLVWTFSKVLLNADGFEEKEQTLIAFLIDFTDSSAGAIIINVY